MFWRCRAVSAVVFLVIRLASVHGLHADGAASVGNIFGSNAAERRFDRARSFRSDIEKLAVARYKEKPQLYYITTTGSTYTVLWDTEAWDGHIAQRRYMRHMRTWHQSSTAKVMFPTVCLITLWAGMVCLGKIKYGLDIDIPMAPLTLISSALAMLLTLRTNQSLMRLHEARLALGRLVLHARVVAGILATRVSPLRPEAAFLAARLLCTVGWSLKAAMVSRGAERVDLAMLNLLLPPLEAAWISKQRKPAIAALDRIGHILRSVAEDPEYSDRCRQIPVKFCESLMQMRISACTSLSERVHE